MAQSASCGCQGRSFALPLPARHNFSCELYSALTRLLSLLLSLLSPLLSPAAEVHKAEALLTSVVASWRRLGRDAELCAAMNNLGACLAAQQQGARASVRKLRAPAPHAGILRDHPSLISHSHFSSLLLPLVPPTVSQRGGCRRRSSST